MTSAEQLAEDARQAIETALQQLGTAIYGPYARLDEDARAGYLDLHTTTAAIVQRLAYEVGPQIRELEAQYQAIAGAVALFEQQRLANLAAPLQAAQQRLGSSILTSIKYSGASSNGH